jgi:hypothetical protein
MSIGISTGSLPSMESFLLGPSRNGRSQSEVKCGSQFHRSLSPDLSAVPVNDPLDGGEADTSAGKLLRRMQPLKCPKEPRCISWIKPGSIIANETDRPAIFFAPANFDSRMTMSRCIFPGVPEQVLHHHPQQFGVAIDDRALCDYELYLALRFSPLEFLCDEPRQRA